MSLVVSAFWYDTETGEFTEHTDWENGHQMAGAETSRWELWGSEAVRHRGASFLPRLAETNLRVGPEELDGFEVEVRALLDDVASLASESGRKEEILRHYLSNFLLAVAYARSKGGGVSID
jgi:hypothetical protein